MALLILAFTGTNVSIASGASDNPYGHAKCGPHAARLIGEDGKLSFDRETLVQAARSVLIEVLSLRRNRSDSGLIARIAGDAVGADQFLPNMATEDFLSCLSRNALEATAEAAGVPGRIKVKDTRAALVEHFAEGTLVHPAALIAPSTEDVRSWAGRHTSVGGLEDAQDDPDTLEDQLVGGDLVDHAAEEEAGEGFREAAE
jgi:ParB family chromosome partitioning protein